ncbi:Olfactory receptor 14I1 [Heterocephalus glaber]|uniref:Olfactory receptor 14I1 n=1 Tax=Heterocephalus glaber TaxID=10181 RepID=G5B427_HETGA|nr:Olfactory receptor 14I1 [Heterocephalus glaber]
MDNITIFTEFLLMDITSSQELQVLQGVLFLVIYLGTLTGNLVTVTVIMTDTHLQSPMYFFISNMALLDLGSISVIVPKAIVNTTTGSKTIFLTECAAQIFLYISLAAVEIANIFSSVLKTCSVESCNKAMSTCTPQLAILLLFLISGPVAVLGPIAKKPSLKNLLTAMFYTIVPPFVNLIIYCLCNGDINAALQRMFKRFPEISVKNFLTKTKTSSIFGK